MPTDLSEITRLLADMQTMVHAADPDRHALTTFSEKEWRAALPKLLDALWVAVSMIRGEDLSHPCSCLPSVLVSARLTRLAAILKGGGA